MFRRSAGDSTFSGDEVFRSRFRPALLDRLS
jgi:hypothetical protein